MKLGSNLFHIKKVLGRGGMAEVLLALRSGPAGFSRKVVVKRILPERNTDPLYVQRFIREASLAAKLHHPCIVEILELGNSAGDYYIVMEYVEGRNLHDVGKLMHQRGERVPVNIAMRIIAEVAGALHYAHTFVGDDNVKHRIVHRDVSTTNIMLSFSGQVKLVDFGLAKDVDAQSLTVGDGILGKPLYMSPESLRGGKPDPGWDVYALGMTLYVLLAGGPPFNTKSGSGGLAALIHDVVNKKPPPVRKSNSEISPELDALTMSCLAKSARDRPASAAALQIELEKLLAGMTPVGSANLAAFVGNLFEREMPGGEASSKEISAISNESRGGPSAELVVEPLYEEPPKRWPRIALASFFALATVFAVIGIWRTELARVFDGLFGLEAVPVEVSAPLAPRDPPPVRVLPATVVIECAGWGYVTVDGRRVGTCPSPPLVVSPGKHKIGLETTTGRVVRDIDAGPGEVVDVSFVQSRGPGKTRIVNPTPR